MVEVLGGRWKRGQGCDEVLLRPRGRVCKLETSRDICRWSWKLVSYILEQLSLFLLSCLEVKCHCEELSILAVIELRIGVRADFRSQNIIVLPDLNCVTSITHWPRSNTSLVDIDMVPIDIGEIVIILHNRNIEALTKSSELGLDFVDTLT